MYAIRSYYDSISTPSIVAQIMYLKFVMGIPFNRQEKEWFRMGLVLTRITSYNVCYTKLLRTVSMAKKIEKYRHIWYNYPNKNKGNLPMTEQEEILKLRALFFFPFAWLMGGFVITSYSIHYTKLYDWLFIDTLSE